MATAYQLAAFSVQAEFGDADGIRRDAEYKGRKASRNFPEYLIGRLMSITDEEIEEEVT